VSTHCDSTERKERTNPKSEMIYGSVCERVCCSDDRRSGVVRRQVFPVVRSMADARETFSSAHLWQQRQRPCGSIGIRVWSGDTDDWIDRTCSQLLDTEARMVDAVDVVF